MDEKAIQRKIGSRIQKLRKQKGYTQQSFSEAIGISNNYLSQLERGGSSPRMDKLVAIMNTLGCSADDIFCDVTDCGYVAKSTWLTQKIEKLSAQDRERILKIVEALSDTQQDNV